MKSTLADANEHRRWGRYPAVFGQLLAKCQMFLAGQGQKKKFRFKNRLISLDSSVIDFSLSREDIQLFKAMMAGEHPIQGLSNADLCMCLQGSIHLHDLADNPKKQSARVSRILSRFHANKLIATIPRTRRWRLTDRGKQIMAAFLCLRDAAFPEFLYSNTAA